MWCNQIFSLLSLIQTATEDRSAVYRIDNIIVADNYEIASKIARAHYGENAVAMDTTFYPVSIGFTFSDGNFYNEYEEVVEKNKTEVERIDELEGLLMTSDEAVVSLYEMQMTQSEINDAQDEAITGLYELMLS